MGSVSHSLVFGLSSEVICKVCGPVPSLLFSLADLIWVLCTMYFISSFIAKRNIQEVPFSSSSSIAMPQEERKCQPRKQPVHCSTQGRKGVPGRSNETPKSSARPIGKTTRQNLTLFDWMSVYTYVDALPQPINQGEVVKHFATRSDGALSTLDMFFNPKST